jgi:tetrahydromethanopterin S-methyltransferase subunit A
MTEVCHQAAAAKKCWACGCLHGALETIERVLPAPERPAGLTAAVAGARATLTLVRYDCLGCDVCFPPASYVSLSAQAAYRHTPPRESLLTMP